MLALLSDTHRELWTMMNVARKKSQLLTYPDLFTCLLDDQGFPRIGMLNSEPWGEELKEPDGRQKIVAC